MLLFLDYFIAVFHLSLTIFNIIGWVWSITRQWHLISLSLTLGAWLILGIWYGLGYCPLTDWHWDIKRQLGELKLPYSFIKYYLDKLLNANLDPALVNNMTAAVMILLVVVTTAVNNKFLFKFLKRK